MDLFIWKIYRIFTKYMHEKKNSSLWAKKTWKKFFFSMNKLVKMVDMDTVTCYSWYLWVNREPNGRIGNSIFPSALSQLLAQWIHSGCFVVLNSCICLSPGSLCLNSPIFWLNSLPYSGNSESRWIVYMYMQIAFPPVSMVYTNLHPFTTTSNGINAGCKNSNQA